MTLPFPHAEILQRFRAAFGEPDNTLGTDCHWGLRPRPDLDCINVLLNGSLEEPALWVFDPHAKSDGMMKAFFTSLDHVDALIRQIQGRVAHASTLDGG
jgi:hypothetical protein